MGKSSNLNSTPVKEGAILYTTDDNKLYIDTTKHNLVAQNYNNATTTVSGLMSASDKSKLDGVVSGANKTTVDSALSSTSTNPVQNKVVNEALEGKAASSHSHTEYAAASHNHSAAAITSSTLPVSRGGTGNTSVDSTPTSGSKKMVTSGGVYTAISNLTPTWHLMGQSICNATTFTGYSIAKSFTDLGGTAISLNAEEFDKVLKIKLIFNLDATVPKTFVVSNTIYYVEIYYTFSGTASCTNYVSKSSPSTNSTQIKISYECSGGFTMSSISGLYFPIYEGNTGSYANKQHIINFKLNPSLYIYTGLYNTSYLTTTINSGSCSLYGYY